MRVDIKNISIASLLLSALPVAIFAVMLVGVFIDMFAATTEPMFKVLVSSFFMAVAQTLIVLITIVIAAFIYNLLCSIGFKAIRISLTDVEEKTGDK